MENPYQSPMEPLGPSSPGDPFRRRPGLVWHVRTVAILMIVQAILEFLASVGLGAMAVFMPIMMRQAPPQGGTPFQAMWILPLMYGGMAAAALTAGVLHLAAGLQNYRFRGRTLGIVALAGGAVTLVTCYCLPTAIALSIYGLIVYLNREVGEAFGMAEAGREPSEILAAFRG